MINNTKFKVVPAIRTIHCRGCDKLISKGETILRRDIYLRGKSLAIVLCDSCCQDIGNIFKHGSSILEKEALQ